MKKRLLKLFSKTIFSALLMLAITFAINSCKKDNKPVGQNNAVVEATSHFAITDARTWFSGNKTMLASKIKLNSETSFLSKISDFTPQWDSARTAVDTNYYVVEAPAKYVNRILFTTDGSINNVNGLTRLLILKDKRNGNLSAALMQVHGEPGVNYSNVHYMAVPQNFSGNIFYTTLQGLFVNGNVYENGKIILTSQSNSVTTKPTGPQVLTAPAPGTCEVVVIGFFEQTCFTSQDVIFCGPEKLLYTQEFTYCTPAVGTPGGGYDPPCPPGSGPTNPTNPNPGGGGNPPFQPPITVESVDGKLIIRLVQGGDPPPGDGGGCPMNVPIPDIISKLKDSCLNKVLTKLLTNSNMNDKIGDIIHNTFLTNDKVKLSFEEYYEPGGKPAKTEVPTTTNGVYNETIKINLSEVVSASQEFKAIIMIHETLHAYMNYNGQYYLNQLSQHREIAEKYVEGIREYVQSIYQIDDVQAYSIILNGLSDTFGANKPAYFQTLLTKYNVSDPLGNYEFQRAGLSGTGCNQN